MDESQNDSCDSDMEWTLVKNQQEDLKEVEKLMNKTKLTASDEEEHSDGGLSIEVIEGVKTDASDSENEILEPRDENQIDENTKEAPQETITVDSAKKDDLELNKGQDWRILINFCPNIVCFVLVVCLIQYVIRLSLDITSMRSEVSQLSKHVVELEQEIFILKASKLITEQPEHLVSEQVETTEWLEKAEFEDKAVEITETVSEIKSDETEPEQKFDSEFRDKLRSIFKSLDEEVASFKLGRQTVNVSEEAKSEKQRKKLLKKPKAFIFEKNDLKSFKTKFKPKSKRAGRFEL